MENKTKRKKKMRNRRVIFVIISILLCILITGGVYAYSKLNAIKTAPMPESTSDLGIDEELIEEVKQKDIINVALFGIDSRDMTSDANSRSDSMMILTIDNLHDKIKLTSLMRDTYVKVSGYGNTKLTHAYAYGGAPLAVKTINENFGTNISDFATIDFFGLEKIINALGGLEINVKESEIKKGKVNAPLLNEYITEMASIEGVVPNYITKAGMQTLTGMQAVAYARIRYAGNGDYERTERQRAVMQQVIQKATHAGITKYPGLINALLPYVTTSLSKAQILKIGTSVIKNNISTIEQLRLPEDEFSSGQMIDKVSYIVADLKVARQHLYKFIYEEEKKAEPTTATTPKATTQKN